MSQLFFLFLFHNDSYYVHDDTNASSLFLLKKDFYVTRERVDAFCLFLLQKNFATFYMLFVEAFLCVFDNLYLPFLYIEKKYICKKCFL